MTHTDWLEKWGNRYSQSAYAEIEKYRATITELREQSQQATNANEREDYEALIDHQQGMIEDVLRSFRQIQRLAKRRWNLELPELFPDTPKQSS